MPDCLTALLAVVDHNSVPWLQFVVLGDLGGHEEEMTENLLMLLLCLQIESILWFLVDSYSDESCEPVSLLWDDQSVEWSLWVDVLEGEALDTIRKRF